MATLVSTGDMEEEKFRTDAGVWKVDLFWEVGPMKGAAGSDDFYALDQVPYHMYFNWREALHGVYWHDNFGYYWSHGCVNLRVSDAKWLWDNWIRLDTESTCTTKSRAKAEHAAHRSSARADLAIARRRIGQMGERLTEGAGRFCSVVRVPGWLPTH